MTFKIKHSHPAGPYSGRFLVGKGRGQEEDGGSLGTRTPVPQGPTEGLPFTRFRIVVGIKKKSVESGKPE